jgi:hypothetical protein
MLTKKDEDFIREIVNNDLVADAVIRCAHVVDAWSASATGAPLDPKKTEDALNHALWLQSTNGYFVSFGVMLRALMMQTVQQARMLRGSATPFDPTAAFLGATLPAVTATLDARGPLNVADVAMKTQAFIASR